MTINSLHDGQAFSHDDEMPERASRQFDPRTRNLIEAPITPTLLRLAAPNVLVMVVQASVGLIETYFVGKLGTDALAGVALVFPALMLMQMMSAGAMGGGISSAIARALGAGRRADANALALHALAIGAIFGLAFTVSVLAGGRFLYGALGGTGASLAAALTYSNVIFAGAILLWLFNSLANVIRGTGNMAVPAAVTCVGAALLIPLSPCLIFGWGPFPRLEIAGGAVAVVAFYALGSLALLAYLVAGPARGPHPPRKKMQAITNCGKPTRTGTPMPHTLRHIPAESTEVDAHNSYVRRWFTCEYVAFLGGKHDNQNNARDGVQFETTSK